MEALWPILSIMLLVFLFGVNLYGMVMFSYLTINAPSGNEVYLLVAALCTYACYSSSTTLAKFYKLVQEALKNEPK